LARKVEALRRRTGQSTTDIVKASIESYYVRVAGDSNAAARLADFVACATGPRTLSERYKRDLSRSLLRKTKS
jgi:hypothetical protein